MRTQAISFLLLGFLSRAAGADEAPARKPVTAETETTLVEVPVHVVGRDGAPLRNLTRADFEVLDDGQRVELADVERFDLEDFSKAPGAEALPLPPAARRRFFLLFDLSFSTPVKLSRARSAARDFVLNGVKNGDVVAVATHDAEKGLKLVLSFTADRDTVASAIDSLALPSLTQASADPLALVVPGSLSGNGISSGSSAARSDGEREAGEQLGAVASSSRKSFDGYQKGRVQQTIKQYGDLARTLSSVRGRKHILLFSEGFDSRLLVGLSNGASALGGGNDVVNGEIWKVDNDDRFGSSELKDRLSEALATFNRADCVIHAIDVAGLSDRSTNPQSSSPGDADAAGREGGRGRGQESLFLLAHETGGEVWKNSNDLQGQLERLQQQTSVVYVLTFTPKKLTEPGRFHALSVKVKTPGARVSARSGYYEPRPYSKLSVAEKRLVTAELIAFGLPRSEIAARVLAAPFRVAGQEKLEVPVIVEIPGARLLADAPATGTMTLELYAYATDERVRVGDFVSQTFTLDLGKAGKQLREGGLKYYGALSLLPGSYWLKVLVRDPQSGRTGLQVVPVTVPLPAKERPEPFVLPPFFHEAPGLWTMVKGPVRGTLSYPFVAKADPYVPSPLVEIPRNGSAAVSFVVYNLGDDPVVVEARIRGTDGKDWGLAALSPPQSDEKGAMGARHLLASLTARDLPPGTYTLLATVRDGVSGLEGQSAATFSVSAR